MRSGTVYAYAYDERCFLIRIHISSWHACTVRRSVERKKPLQNDIRVLRVQPQQCKNIPPSKHNRVPGIHGPLEGTLAM
jgi:hypothetical protein